MGTRACATTGRGERESGEQDGTQESPVSDREESDDGSRQTGQGRQQRTGRPAGSGWWLGLLMIVALVTCCSAKQFEGTQSQYGNRQMQHPEGTRSAAYAAIRAAANAKKVSRAHTQNLSAQAAETTARGDGGAEDTAEGTGVAKQAMKAAADNAKKRSEGRSGRAR